MLCVIPSDIPWDIMPKVILLFEETGLQLNITSVLSASYHVSAFFVPQFVPSAEMTFIEYTLPVGHVPGWMSPKVNLPSVPVVPANFSPCP